MLELHKIIIVSNVVALLIVFLLFRSEVVSGEGLDL